MSENGTEDVLAGIDRRLIALGSAEKQLKKRSTISFVERTQLASKAAKAATELRTQRDALAATEPIPDEESLPQAAKDAIAQADKVLGQIEDAQPGGQKLGGGGSRKLPGQQARGAVGASQQRGPDRIGE
jgi:hypothetical protein